MEMTTVKTIAVFAVILGCFAVLYPKIFHPLLLNVFGMSPPDKSVHNDMMNQLPPHLRKPNMGKATPVNPGARSVPDDMARHMKVGPHPGMRQAAEMQKQAQQGGGGGGKGMMTVVLPMYAIGIVIYLVYTLSKVFGGRKKPSQKDAKIIRQMQQKGVSEVRYDSDRRKFMYGDEDSDKEEDDFQHFKHNRRQKRDLEKLLYKADKEQISDLEMRELKRRLLETEAQMTRILSAMETVTEKVIPQKTTFEHSQNDYLEDDTEGNVKGNFRPPKRTSRNRADKDASLRRRNIKPGNCKSAVQSSTEKLLSRSSKKDSTFRYKNKENVSSEPDHGDNMDEYLAGKMYSKRNDQEFIDKDSNDQEYCDNYEVQNHFEEMDNLEDTNQIDYNKRDYEENMSLSVGDIGHKNDDGDDDDNKDDYDDVNNDEDEGSVEEDLYSGSESNDDDYNEENENISQEESCTSDYSEDPDEENFNEQRQKQESMLKKLKESLITDNHEDDNNDFSPNNGGYDDDDFDDEEGHSEEDLLEDNDSDTGVGVINVDTDVRRRKIVKKKENSDD